MDAQAGLRLCCMQTTEDRFSRDEAHIMYVLEQNQGLIWTLMELLKEILDKVMFERIHNTKEQIIFYERAEKHKSKERTILSFKRALFPGNDQVMTSQVIMK